MTKAGMGEAQGVGAAARGVCMKHVRDGKGQEGMRVVWFAGPTLGTHGRGVQTLFCRWRHRYNESFPILGKFSLEQETMLLWSQQWSRKMPLPLGYVINSPQGQPDTRRRRVPENHVNPQPRGGLSSLPSPLPECAQTSPHHTPASGPETPP